MIFKKRNPWIEGRDVCLLSIKGRVSITKLGVVLLVPLQIDRCITILPIYKISMEEDGLGAAFQGRFIPVLKIEDNVSPLGSGSLLVMGTFFKRGQTYHDRENREIAVERDLASGQTCVDTYPASPNMSQNHLCGPDRLTS